MKKSESSPEEINAWKPHPISRSAFSVIAVSFYLTQVGIGFAVYHGNYWVAVPLVFFCSHFMHALLVGFHEASHGLLKKSRRFNNFEGLLMGTVSFMSFTLYRITHQAHHSHLGSKRDVELWPFVDTEIPRWARVVAAFFELTFGLVYTPFLFMREFFRKGSSVRSKRMRRRIWAEFAAMGVVWFLILGAVGWFGLWNYLLWMYFLPSWIAGNLQSWRKYVEHVGLTGRTVRSGTRSIVADNWVGKLVSFTLLHEPFHGVHHLHMGLPHAELPGRVDSLTPTTPEEMAPFPNYRSAIVHLLRSLRDPKVGSQWQDIQQKAG